MHKITVGISCYKQKRWLHRCLRSLVNQTIGKDKFEVILVNDDPEENLEDICNTFADYLNIRLINNEENLGLPVSLNKILHNSLGQYFVRVDSDDYVSKHFLYTLSNFLDMNSGPRIMGSGMNCQAVACDYFKVDNTGQLISRHSAEKEFVACGIMFTYESLCDVGFYDEEYKMREGHEMIRRFKEKYKVYNLPMPLYKYRIHDSNRTNNISQVQNYDDMLKGEK
jgi:glycosyltransferase involved in cell wall biosynthesis